MGTVLPAPSVSSLGLASRSPPKEIALEIRATSPRSAVTPAEAVKPL